MNLSKYFTLAELTVSETATRKGIDNTPSPTVLANLARMAALLEFVRALHGKPIVVTSGYRSPAVNKAVGGSETSAHMSGLAADIICPGMTPKALAESIRTSGIVFDQLILEYPDRNGWVHIGLSTRPPRQEVKTKLTGKPYIPGLV